MDGTLKNIVSKSVIFDPLPPYFVIFLLSKVSNLVKTHLCVVKKDYLWEKRIIFNDYSIAKDSWT